MDFITGLPPVWFEGQEVNAVLVVDRYTKMAEFIPPRLSSIQQGWHNS